MCVGCGVPRGAIDGADGGTSDATMDAAMDASMDAPFDAPGDAGIDAPEDAGIDASEDGGPVDAGPDAFDGGVDACMAGDDLCDGIDSDCDGSTDEDELTRSCGVGSECGQACVDGMFESACTNLSDPGATEICINGDDDDCDGSVDENCDCVPGTMTACGPCGDGIQTCTPEGMMGTCEGASLPNTWYVDEDGDGYGTGAAMTDCDPAMGRVDNDDDCNDMCFDCNPMGTEVCDGLDNDCNMMVDEGVTSDFWVDADGDGYGDGTMLMNGCGGPGLVDNPDDCNDACAYCFPGFPFGELCDGLDNDCNMMVDDDCDDCFVETTPTNGDYVVCDFAVGSFFTARDICRAAGWEMLIIDDATENMEVWDVLDPYDRTFWAGGVESSGNDWFWVDGSALATDCTSGGCTCASYCNWLSGQPNSALANDCSYFTTGDGGQWADSWCNDNRAFVCEVP